MLDRLKTRWWYVYLATQVVGLFHAFYPLLFHYRHTVGRILILPLLPGGVIAMMLDWMWRGHSWALLVHVPPLQTRDEVFIGVATLIINCVIFALVVLVVRWAVRVRKNSWRKNAYTFD